MALTLEITVGVIVLFMVMSILYKNNVFFRIGTMLMVAGTLGYNLPVALDNIYTRNLVPISKGNLSFILPVVISFLLFTTFFKKTAFLAKFPSAITVGAGLGAATAGAVVAALYANLLATAEITNVNIAITSIMTILIMLFFLQTFSRKNMVFKPVYLAGQALILIYFGVGLGAYTIARFSQAIGRFEYVLLTWLEL